MLKEAPFYASVPVRDLDRARRFYEDTLGLGPATQVGPALCFPCGGGTTCLIYPSPGAGAQQGACAFWRVDRLEAVVEWLRSRGVALEQVEGAAACFRDSEGNRVALMQMEAVPA